MIVIYLVYLRDIIYVQDIFKNRYSVKHYSPFI